MTPPATKFAAARRFGIEYVRHYHRLDLTIPDEKFDQPVLFVANHGFGGLFDLNALATLAAFDEMQLARPITTLTHQMAWTLKLGHLLEPMGLQPASRASAQAAFEAGHHVAVVPGGDADAFKSWSDRNRIVFSGRRGFARLAMELGVPIVPIVTAGAGESLVVISDGSRVARALKLNKLLRLKCFPVSVSVPWGLNVGAVGLLPYLPLPTKLSTTVLNPMNPHSAESSDEFGARVETRMQETLTTMTRDRTPLLG
ncbi:lysophospholipid acyltransferase family protein [Antrihabitans sp. YC2-6]|uniref:lysophospholipid acyltransferase family protein n=1 Tax=Antrihabitans sp. YC2-6 TaxID=2799498 RepID=UPI0018F32354|nr:lysophospholipid acyltransferase family protein [Antrihabitans sp. YC2-6]MBJ8347234.1 acyltransferase family protein [Antrihabitans sp. YC2-6]